VARAGYRRQPPAHFLHISKLDDYYRGGGYSFPPGASVFSGLWAGLAGGASSVLAPARPRAGFFAAPVTRRAVVRRMALLPALLRFVAPRLAVLRFLLVFAFRTVFAITPSAIL
jgi:hypothetical protein